MPGLPIHHSRNRAHLHLMQRIVGRDLPIDYAEVRRIEDACETMRPCFEIPGKIKYKLTMTRDCRRYAVVYDTSISCLVSAWSMDR